MDTRSKLILLAAAIVLLSVSNNQLNSWRVKTQYHINRIAVGDHIESIGGLTDTFYYSTNGMKSYAYQGISLREERNGDVITRTNTNKTGKPINITTIFLNRHGLEDSVIIWDSTGRQWTHRYIYDAVDNLIEDREHLPVSEHPASIYTKYKIIEGNRVEEQISYGANATDTIYMANPATGLQEKVIQRYDEVIYHKDYFKNKPNMPVSINFGYPDPEKDSRNLVKRSIQLSAKGDTMDIYLFRYTFDHLGRVTSVAQINRTGEEYDSTAYTYY